MNNPESVDIPESQQVPAANGVAGPVVGVLPKRAAQYDLPFKDDTVVSNFRERSLSMLLTNSIEPWLQKRNPGERFVIGQDNYIFFQLQNPSEDKAKAPDWFCVEGVPPTLNGEPRLSYVLWEEVVIPTIVLEYLSDNRGEEFDRTPRTGKFWAYEQAIQAPFYGIFDPEHGTLEVYALSGGSYQQLTPNAQSRYAIPPLGLELGVWQGRFAGADTVWLRWWDAKQGTLLPTNQEAKEVEKRLKEEALKHAADEKKLKEDEKKLKEEALKHAEDEKKLKEEALKHAEDEKKLKEDEKKLKEEALKHAEDEKKLKEEALKHAEDALKHAEDEKKLKEEAIKYKELLAEKLRALGIDPNSI